MFWVLFKNLVIACRDVMVLDPTRSDSNRTPPIPIVHQRKTVEMCKLFLPGSSFPTSFAASFSVKVSSASKLDGMTGAHEDPLDCIVFGIFLYSQNVEALLKVPPGTGESINLCVSNRYLKPEDNFPCTLS